MKLGARNQLKGKVRTVEHGPVSTRVTVEVGVQLTTSTITSKAAEDLALRVTSRSWRRWGRRAARR
ncbi:TOBE domain-containing protein [Arenibaculum pallidiluteum]|uniref:TOBE domain-containing protein n=1 Tax=Arenibaculum pallidiluteum TaxID=2812559 RepID=UPI001A97BF92